MVLICDLDGTISYASPLASGYSYPTEALIGKPLSDFVHPRTSVPPGRRSPS